MEKEIEAAIQKVSEGKAPEAPIEETGKPAEAPQQLENSADTGKVEAPSTPQNSTWDGDVNKLPPELQVWAKAAQRKLTEKAMADADIRRKGQEYENLTKSEAWQKFQEAQRQPQQAAPQPVQPAESLPITPEEWEEAQLDSSGTKFYGLVAREVQRQIGAAAQVYGGQLQQLQQQAQLNQFQTALSDFADLHPDVMKLHEMGLMKTLLDEEMRSNQHPTYEAAINAAYTRGAEIREAARQEALQEAQGRIAEKQNAVVNPGVSTGEMTRFEAVDSEAAFDKAFEFAANKQKVKVGRKR